MMNKKYIPTLPSNTRTIYLYLALIATPINIITYQHTVSNATPYPVSVKIGYVSLLCRDESFYLEPGKSKTINGKGCVVKYISATIIEHHQKTINATNYKGTYAGSSTWIVTGPFKTNPKNGYIVTRSVQ